MIVGDLKPLEEIVAAVKDFKQVLVLGCGSCVTNLSLNIACKDLPSAPLGI